MSDKWAFSRVWTYEAHLDSGVASVRQWSDRSGRTAFSHTGRFPVSELARGAVPDARHDFCAEEGVTDQIN